MLERMEFCPKCNGTRKMMVSLGLQPVSTKNGPDTILVYDFHCTSCNTFVFSRVAEASELAVAEEVADLKIHAFV